MRSPRPPSPASADWHRPAPVPPHALINVLNVASCLLDPKILFGSRSQLLSLLPFPTQTSRCHPSPHRAQRLEGDLISFVFWFCWWTASLRKFSVPTASNNRAELRGARRHIDKSMQLHCLSSLIAFCIGFPPDFSTPKTVKNPDKPSPGGGDRLRKSLF